jgi:glycosyltransferase involved in cell wall biosynthesis
MKILLVQDTDWIRKNPIQHNHLMERMVMRGHEVRVIDYEFLWRTEGKKNLVSRKQIFRVSRILPDAYHMVIRPGILRIPLLDYASMLFTYRKEIEYQLQEFKPDVVIGDGILTPFLAFGLAEKHHIKTVYYCIDRDYMLIPFPFLQSLGKMMESYNMRQADLVLSINEGLRDYTIRMGTDPKKTSVIRAGVDFQMFDFHINGDKIRKKYGIEKNDTLLFFVGWLYHFSGLKEVAEELSKIHNDTIKLLIVGDGDAYADLQKIQQKFKLGSRMILAGRQPYNRLPEFLAAADICLLPSYNNEIMRDIVPIKIYEYMAMKNPVISTKLPGVMKEFGDDHGVIYIEKPEDVLKKTKEIIDKGELAKEGKLGRKFVENYDWENITNKFDNTLDDLIWKKQN